MREVHSTRCESEIVAGVGPHTFPVAGWEDITSFRWNATGRMAIDHLVILVQPGSGGSIQGLAGGTISDVTVPIDDDLPLP